MSHVYSPVPYHASLTILRGFAFAQSDELCASQMISRGPLEKLGFGHDTDFARYTLSFPS
jgi:hypothetical protein